jgi:hypothetical protein
MVGLRVAGFAALLIGSGCGIFAPDELEKSRIIGTIESYDGVLALELPDTVSAGRDLLIRVVTTKTSCSTGGEPEVTVTNTDTATIIGVVPLDWIFHDVNCTAEGANFDHSVLVRVDRPGRAVVHVFGRRMRGDTLTVTRRIVVEQSTRSRVNAVVLRGRVTDSRRMPVPDAFVGISASSPCHRFASFYTSTDADGAYSRLLAAQANCREMEVHVQVTPRSGRLLSGNAALDLDLVPLETGKEVRVDLQLADW